MISRKFSEIFRKLFPTPGTAEIVSPQEVKDLFRKFSFRSCFFWSRQINIKRISQKDKSKGYDIEKGDHNIIITHKNTKKMKNEKLSLMKKIIKLREDGMNYGEISDHLNDDGIKTIRGSKWSRQSVRRFWDYGSKDLSLVEIQTGEKPDLRGKKKD